MAVPFADPPGCFRGSSPGTRPVRSARLGRSLFTPSAGPRTPLVAGVGAGCLVVAAVADPDTVGNGPVLCPFRLVTGLPCPGCGLTRSWVYLAHGRWAEATTSNPFGAVALAAVVALVVTIGARLVRRRPLPSMGAIVSSRAFAVVASLWLVFGAVRLVLVATA
jgi:hypothetical protein